MNIWKARFSVWDFWGMVFAIYAFVEHFYWWQPTIGIFLWLFIGQIINNRLEK